ncbi:MAG: hypothetical protein O3B01_29495 [Planctomycetota bacterium]|nr:hypothetical protein [Planctomycetota bacterium]MDA1142717.1 hypothetical protein [Planctomycetota bacterium]
MALAIGAALGYGIMYFNAGLIRKYVVGNNPVLMIAGVLILVGFTIYMGYRLKKLKENC